MKPSNFILIIATIFWGVLLGGVAYSHLVYFPAYLSDLPKSAAIVNGPYAIKEGIFWMIIHPVLIFSLIIALVMNWKNKVRRKLILTSFSWYVIVLIISFTYFVPELMKFSDSMSSNIPASDWASRGHTWFMLSIIRGVSIFISGIPLFVALTKQNVAQGYA